jgi:hypothetical protein
MHVERRVESFRSGFRQALGRGWESLNIIVAPLGLSSVPGICSCHPTGRGGYPLLHVTTSEYPLFQDPEVVLQEPTVEALEESKSPHRDKLRELVYNPKLPEMDKGRVQEALGAYEEWRRSARSLRSTGEQRILDLVELLNAYKLKIEVDLIMGSSDSFLYRQNGQLKITSSILEEFLPDLIDPSIFPYLAICQGSRRVRSKRLRQCRSKAG